MSRAVWISLLPIAVGLMACQPSLTEPAVSRFIEPRLIQTRAEAPPGADPNTCWGKDVTPGIYETVTEQIMLQPAQVASDGAVLAPPVFKTETRQSIVRQRTELWFQTVCAADMTPEFVGSLQRALAVRGLYGGPVTGEMNTRTRSAIRKFQTEQGVESGIISLAAARQLGLVAVEFQPNDAG
jgi:hypothetical protein